MSKVFFGFALADSMFTQEEVSLVRKRISVKEAVDLINQGVLPCLNPSHVATISAMNERFGIEVEIPAIAPKVELENGDKLIVMSIKGLPRLDATRHEYTTEEVAQATFDFSLWYVCNQDYDYLLGMVNWERANPVNDGYYRWDGDPQPPLER